MFPPSSLVLRVTTTAPTQKMTKTSANCGPPSPLSLVLLLLLSGDDPCNIIAMNTHRINGPQRSHSFKSALLCLGYSTCQNLIPIAFKSLIMVSLTGSSNVLNSCSSPSVPALGDRISPSNGTSFRPKTK